NRIDRMQQRARNNRGAVSPT
ncbi:putative lipo domain protein, partial [Vibrio parahaemolyticus V-223/04]